MTTAKAHALPDRFETLPIRGALHYLLITEDVAGQFEVRRQAATESEVFEDPKIVGRGTTLEEARAFVPKDLVRVPRLLGDDPCVVEAWFEGWF